MRRFLAAVLAAGAVGALTANAKALMIAMNPPVRRAVTSEVVVVGKVTAIEKDTVEATPFPAAPNKVQYKVAVVKIESALAGASNLTHLKVGFVPPPPPRAQPVPVPGGGLVRPAIGRIGGGGTDLKVDQEYVFFLTKHHGGDFYAMPMMNPPIDTKDEAAKKNIEDVKKVLAVVADPVKSLKSDQPADRYFAATALVAKYRTPAESGREHEETPIGAEESKLILAALGEGDWMKFDRDGANGMQAFFQLGVTEKDGWVPPKVPPRAPGQPAVNFNKVTHDAFVTWLAGPGKDYQIKRFVAKQK